MQAELASWKGQLKTPISVKHFSHVLSVVLNVNGVKNDNVKIGML